MMRWRIYSGTQSRAENLGTGLMLGPLKFTIFQVESAGYGTRVALIGMIVGVLMRRHSYVFYTMLFRGV